jgi:site-specific recombinase XerC
MLGSLSEADDAVQEAWLRLNRSDASEVENLGAWLTTVVARMKPPIVPDKPILVVPEDALRRLLAAGAGKGFEARRDTALLLLLMDIGPRRGELANVQLADVDFDLEVIAVLGKGRRPRSLPFGRNSALALDRYLAGTCPTPPCPSPLAVVAPGAI